MREHEKYAQKHALTLDNLIAGDTITHTHARTRAYKYVYIYMDVFTDIKASATTTNASPPRKNDFAKKIEDGLVPAHSSRVRVLLL